MKIKLTRTGRTLSVLVGILTAMIVSGCTSPDTARLVARNSKLADHTVTINFDDGCPKTVSVPEQEKCNETEKQQLCVKRGQSVEWISDPVGTAFEVYFDPFVGRPYISHGTDETTSAIIIRRGSMPGEYKYSVLGVTCKSEVDDPVLDPPMRVER